MATSDKEVQGDSKPKAKAERPVVSLAGLVKEFGPEEGEAKYFAIARLEGPVKTAAGEVTGRYFFDPAAEGPTYRPDLIIATLPPEARKAAADIISTPQVKES
jgi:hypothetical protein